MSDIEKPTSFFSILTEPYIFPVKGKEKLKNWQNRKLLEIHNQYLDALDEIGMGHKEAENLADESDVLDQERLANERLAKDRGRIAETKLQVEKNEKSFKKALPIQHKKLVRDIENTRAAMVSSMKRKSPTKKKAYTKTKKNKTSTDINISIPNDSDFSEASTSSSDSSKQLPSIPEDGNNADDSEGFCECSESSDEVDRLEERRNSAKETFRRPENFQTSRSKEMDTRISDRIRRRRFKATEPDYCDFVEDCLQPKVSRCYVNFFLLLSTLKIGCF